MCCLEYIVNSLGQELYFHLPDVFYVLMFLFKQKICAEERLFLSVQENEINVSKFYPLHVYLNGEGGNWPTCIIQAGISTPGMNFSIVHGLVWQLGHAVRACSSSPQHHGMLYNVSI